MKKAYGVVNTQQFHLTFTQRRPKSCVERVYTTKKTHDSPAINKEKHDEEIFVPSFAPQICSAAFHWQTFYFESEIVRRCKSQQEVSRSSSAATNNQRLFSHDCLCLDPEKISNGIKSQQILISSALRRPHASCYSLLDSQSIPEPAKPRRPTYRPKSASTVYSYAERPLSACEISSHLGRQTKASLLRSKSSYDVRSTSNEPPRPSTDKVIRKKKPCVVREEYILHKNSLTPKEVFDYMKSVHAYLTGARYNRSRLVDAKSLTKHGLYVSKDGLGSFILDKAKAASSDKEHDVPKAALKVVGSQTSQVNVINVGTNTEPYYLSLNKWHDAEWNQGKKHLPPHKNDYRRLISPNKVKPIKTEYIDYNTMVK